MKEEHLHAKERVPMCNILLNNVKYGELYSCRAESSLLKCYAMSTSHQIPTFRRIVVPSSSQLSIPNNIATLMACQNVLTILSGEKIYEEASRTAKRLPGLPDPENEDNTLLPSVGNYFPVHMATKQSRNLDSANAVRIILLLCKD